MRSPLPNRQPSRRSAPAIRANSPAAVPVPRSLCGCTDSTIASRRARLRCIHSIMSAKMLGVECSTVDGRLTMHLRSGVGCQTSVTASTTRLENASSVPENISGEYWKVQSRVRLLRRQLAEQRGHAWWPVRRCRPRPCPAPPGASPARWRCTGARWRAARPAATRRCARISGSRACVSTWIVTSSGIRSSSISLRTKSNSICEADGKADLDLLEADRHQRLEHAQLARRCPSARSAPGCRRAGRRCTRSGACVSTASGQVRSLQADRGEGAVLGLRVASTWMILSWWCGSTSNPKQNGPLLVQTGRGEGIARALPSPPVGDQ